MPKWEEEVEECPERDIVERFVWENLFEIFADLEQAYGGRSVRGP